MGELKLFRVIKRTIPEWGESKVHWEKYFLANSTETVSAIVRQRYGEDHYYTYDETYVRFEIKEIEDVEIL